MRASLDGADKAPSAAAGAPATAPSGAQAGDNGAARDAPALPGGSSGSGGAGCGLAVEVARLSAQLAAQTHEVFRLQEAALRAKQVWDHERSSGLHGFGMPHRGTSDLVQPDDDLVQILSRH